MARLRALYQSRPLLPGTGQVRNRPRTQTQPRTPRTTMASLRVLNQSLPLRPRTGPGTVACTTGNRQHTIHWDHLESCPSSPRLQSSLTRRRPDRNSAERQWVVATLSHSLPLRPDPACLGSRSMPRHSDPYRKPSPDGRRVIPCLGILRRSTPDTETETAP